MGKPKPLISRIAECSATANEYYPLTEGKYHLGCKNRGMKAEGGLSCLAGSGQQSVSKPHRELRSLATQQHATGDAVHPCLVPCWPGFCLVSSPPQLLALCACCCSCSLTLIAVFGCSPLSHTHSHSPAVYLQTRLLI